MKIRRVPMDFGVRKIVQWEYQGRFYDSWFEAYFSYLINVIPGGKICT
jgi:hypothetical protein